MGKRTAIDVKTMVITLAMQTTLAGKNHATVAAQVQVHQIMVATPEMATHHATQTTPADCLHATAADNK